jgi:hypothetical protein
MLHAVIESRVPNPERSGQTRIIHKGNGIADRGGKTVLEHRIEDSVGVDVSNSENIQNTELTGIQTCNVDQKIAKVYL